MDEALKEKLVAEMKALLISYKWQPTESALQKIVEQWHKSKKGLIDILSKYPQWNSDKFYIAFDHDYVHEGNIREMKDFLYGWIGRHMSNTECDKIILKEFPTFAKEYEAMVIDMNNATNRTFFYHVPPLTQNFHSSVISYFADYMSSPTLTKEDETFLNAHIPELRVKAGQKVSRVVNKICTKLKLNKQPDYNKAFAYASDALNPIKYKRHTILSVNPIDYLLMANGNSWSSCMTIDVFQVHQDGWHGESSSGCLSYMLDESSMVFYTVDGKYSGDKLELQPKIHRQMYHYGNGKLLQARLYPQSCDNARSNNLREDIRTLVQKIIADCLGKPNFWVLERDVDRYMKDVSTVNDSTHFPDYMYDRNKCTMSCLKDFSDNKDAFITIGTKPICIKCGKRHDYKRVLYCYNCNESDDDDDYDDNDVIEDVEW